MAICLWLGGITTSSYSILNFTETAGLQRVSVLLGMACGMLFAGTAMRIMLLYTARRRTPMAHYIGRVMAMRSWFSVAVICGIVGSTQLHLPITKTLAHGIMISVLVMVAVHLVYAWSRSKQFVPSTAELNGPTLARWPFLLQPPGSCSLRSTSQRFRLHSQYRQYFFWAMRQFALEQFAIYKYFYLWIPLLGRQQGFFYRRRGLIHLGFNGAFVALYGPVLGTALRG